MNHGKKLEQMTREELIAELRARTAALVKSQEELAFCRDRYADMYDSAPLGYATLAPDGTIQEINRTGAQSLGAERPKLLGAPLEKFLAPESLEAFRAHRQACRAGAPAAATFVRIATPDGGTLPMQLSSKPAANPDGTVSIRTALTDLTERERAEQAVLQLNADLELRVRQRTEELEAANRHLREEVERRANAQQQLKDYARALENANRALHKAYEDARTADRARLDSERAARAEAEKTSQIKDEFLATLSHELRTPLNALLGWAQLLRSGRLSPEETERALEVIERNIRLQSQLVSDLLDMSRIISGKFSLDLQSVALGPVVESVVDSVRLSADISGVKIETKVDDAVGELTADPNRLQQVLWNLLQNAVKFSARGGRVALQAKSRNGNVEIRVSDNGIGIRPEFLPYVFDRFRQADASRTRRQGGLGLGLSIVRHLVEAHGGTVTAESEGETKGATFTILLPVGYPDARAAGADQASLRIPFDPAAVQGIKVLVVDDDPDSRALIGRQLEDLDAVVVLAASATEALRKLRSFRPDVIVSDIGMPDEDGYDLIRNVRNIKQVSDIPALALTAFARPEDREQSLQAGYQMHLSKPVEMARLCTAIARLAARGKAAARDAPPAPAEPPPPAHQAHRTPRRLQASPESRLRILVVDDSDDSAAYVAAVLEMQGYEVMIARDGSSAVEIATLFRPQLVLLDIGLPDLDGFTVARRLRGHADLKDTVVVAVTGYGIDRQRLDESPVDAYLQKPLEPDTLTDFIRKLTAQP